MTALSSKLLQKIDVTEHVGPRGTAEFQGRVLSALRCGSGGYLETTR